MENTVILTKNNKEDGLAVDWFKSKGIDTGIYIGGRDSTDVYIRYYGVIKGKFGLWGCCELPKTDMDVLSIDDITENKFPRMMMVWNGSSRPTKRWVIAKHGDYYISVGNTNCERIAMLSVVTHAYRYAYEAPEEIEVTIDDIAKWKGVDPSTIKIVK